MHFPTAPPCSTKVDVLETGDVPSLFSFLQMKNLDMTTELDPKGDNITCPAFGLYSSPAEYSTMVHIVLDLTSLAFQPTTKSRERSGHPRRHITFAMPERKPAYPALAQDMREDEDDRHLAQRDHSVVSDDGDGQPLVQPAPRKEPAEERRDPASHDGDLAPFVPPRPPPLARRRKGPPVWQDPTATLDQEVSGDSRERAEDASILGNKAEGEALTCIYQ